MKNYIICLVLWLLPGAFMSAQTLSSRLLDKKTSEPISDATVYLDGTSHYHISGEDGRFEIKVNQPYQTKLIIRYLGYKTVTIDKPFEHLPDVIYMEENVEQLSDITIQSRQGEVYSREKRLKAFKDQFLGTTKAGKACKILNEDDLYLIYDSQSKTLTASSKVPIIIENPYMGYTISYDLSMFRIVYSNNSLSNSRVLQTFFAGTSSYVDTSNQEPVILSNRQNSFEKSSRNLMIKLYNGELSKSDFKFSKDEVSLKVEDCFAWTDSSDKVLVTINEKLSQSLLADVQDYSVDGGRLPTTVRQTVVGDIDPNIKGFVDVKHKKDKSQIIFRTEQFVVSSIGTIEPSDKVSFAGHMGSLRIGDQLPLDYLPPGMVIAVKNTKENNIADNMNEQLNIYPQEKVHLHLDRNYYVPGENIWFKAYLTDASTHQFSTLSRYVYVEMISPSDSLVHRIMLAPNNAMFYGNIFLDQIIPEGYYTIRAYTSYMDNAERDYFYTNHIRIGSVTPSEASSAATPKNIKTGSSDYAISFFPEGGNMLEGTLTQIAFKALTDQGAPEYVNGEIVDDSGNVQTTFTTVHDGMGSFGFIPKKGVTYFAKSVNKEGLTKQFELPKANAGAYSLTVSKNADNHLIIGFKQSADVRRSPELNLLMHCRGNILHEGKITGTDKPVTINGDNLPTGVIQVLLYDDQLNPLSERLVFNRSDDQAHMTLSTDKEKYKIRERVSSELIVTDESGVPLSGNFSVAITDDRDLEVDASTSILSTLLLTSELKGTIHTPAYYFNEMSDKTNRALDLVMLTHGWRRYNIPEVIAGKIESPENTPENSMSITGRVTNNLRGTPVAGADVSMLAMSSSEAFVTNTDRNGLFRFGDIEFPGNTRFFISATSSNRNETVKITVDDKQLPAVKASPHIPAEKMPQISDADMQTGRFLEKATENAKYDDNMRMIYLDEVSVVASRITSKPKSSSVFGDFANISYGVEEIERYSPVSVVDALNAVPGVTAIAGEDPSQVIVLLWGRYSPTIRIDDVSYMDEAEEGKGGEIGEMMEEPKPTSAPLGMLSVGDIASIEVFTPGAGSAIFGLQATKGVLNITTRKIADIRQAPKDKPEQLLFTRLGYQVPAEFYSPVYDTEEKKFNIKPDLRTTIFWKPDIVTANDGTASFEFYTSDFTSSYSIVVEGITTDGRIVREVRKINIE